MIIRITAALSLCVISLPAWATSPMSAEEFEKFSLHRTLEYHANGHVIGSEVFQDGQRVIWSRGAGECLAGRWFEAGQQICFVYEDGPDAHCWSFIAEGHTVTGLFDAEPEQTDKYDVRDAPDPVFCPGVDVNV